MNDKLKTIKRILATCGYFNIPNPMVENVYKGNITDIILNDDESVVKFVCLRPGLVIGKGGSNFNYILELIGDETDVSEILIEEDRLWSDIF